MAITKLNLNGTEYPIGNIVNNEITNNYLNGVQMYEGVELNYSWAEMAQIAKAGTAEDEGIRIGDYISISQSFPNYTTDDAGNAISGSYTTKCQVAGIDTYYRCSSTQQGHHIDFISVDCMVPIIMWDSGGNNNGTSDTANPFMASTLYSWLEETVYPGLPSDLQSVITQKQLYAETRYSSSGSLTDSTGNEWITMPHLWIPTEFEVTGASQGGTRYYADRGAVVQYPIFANSKKHIIKGNGNGGSRCHWWLMIPLSGSSSNALNVHYSGNVRSSSVTDTTYRVPLCFRIGA